MLTYAYVVTQSTSTFSRIIEELYICRMITRNTRNKPIKTPITGVVPHPGATLPYSELRGLKISPNRVLNAIILS